MSTAIAVVCALGAACGFSLGSVVQQGVARESPESILGFRLLLSLVQQPRWVAGTALAAASFALQRVTLRLGR